VYSSTAAFAARHVKRASLTLRTALVAAATIVIWSLVPAGASAAPALQLPFPRGEAWETNGPHSWPGGPLPWSHVDFGRGGDRTGTVTAAGAGTFRWQACADGGYQAWVNHGGGWETHYQHLASVAASQGPTVTAGQPIGTTGTNVA
jgi:murein DD-endopeptidase MepM/ murein hydrolase activator NlpD